MVYCTPVVQISMSVQSTMAIVSIYAVTLEAVSHVAVDLATDWVVMADHAQVRKTHLLTLAHARRVIVLSLFVGLSVCLSVCRSVCVCVPVRGFSPWPWQL